jgi:hypothetical protein
MDRRSAIKCSFAVTAGIFLLPSCIQEKTKPPISLRNIDISGNQQSILADLAEAIIPKTSSPGAKDISSHLFTLMMVDDCFDQDAQKKFVSGLAQFDTMAKTKFGSSFINCAPAQKEELLKSMENKTGVPDDILSFYSSMKRLTIQSFTSSQYYLTKIHVYELVPARFHGCVPVTKSA